MLHLVIATRNRHKFRELKALLAVPGVHWHSLLEFPRVPAVKETGRTYDANAIKKATAAARATGLPSLADDSGLEVDALAGKPGVQSARFAGRQGDDRANNEKLLRMVRRVRDGQRAARYRCSLALVVPSSEVVALTRGAWAGRIAATAQGRRGFGYDPIFWVPRFGKTVGELPSSVKQRFSHRAIAAHRMRSVVERLRRRLGRRRSIPWLAVQRGLAGGRQLSAGRAV